MAEEEELAETYERVYSAAARMLWAQGFPAWRRESSGWPRERREACQALESVLLAVEPGAPQPGEPSDPARHLVSRRASGSVDRPITFEEARREWTERLTADPGCLEERTEPFPDLYMVPGGCVVISPGRHLAMVDIFPELFRRLAPGRAPVTMAEDAAELSELAHRAANALREPLGIPVREEHPGAAPWISPVSRRVSEVPELAARLEELRSAAWRAAETLPTPDELKTAVDFTVKMDAAEASVELRQLLAGQPVPAWREEDPRIDPARHSVVGLVEDDRGQARPLPLTEEAGTWRGIFAQGPLPWTPQEYRRQFDPEHYAEEDHVVLSATRALVFAELLDEYAARLYPGRHTGTVHYGAYELGQFISGEIGRELRSHSIF